MVRLFAMILAFLVAAAACAGELVQQGGMEGPFSDGLAGGWRNNCWGKNSVAFSPGSPRSGKCSQQVACRKYDSGAVQFYYPLRVAAGKRYRVSFWMRTEGVVGMVGAGLRQISEPYTMHLSSSFEPGEGWEQYAFEGTSTKSDQQAGLFFWFSPEAPATLWVDDVSVIEGETQPLQLPLPAGNVLPNASFEIALDRDWQWRDVRPSSDAEGPFHGRRSLRWHLDGRPAQLVSRAMEFGGNGRPFTLGLAARAAGEAVVSAEVWPAVTIEAGGPLLRIECRPTSEWETFRAAGPLPASSNGAYYVIVRLRAPGRADVRLDAVRLEPGDGKTPFRCRRPVEASLGSAALGHIYRQGAPIELGLLAFCDGDPPRPSTLACRVTDYWRNPVAEVPVRLELKPQAAASAQVPVPVKKTGVYLAELVDGHEVLGGVSFSVLPPVSSVPAERSAVGGHFRLDRFHMQAANAMGIKWTRIHDCESITHWNTVEPKKGDLAWFDDKVRVAREHGVQVLGEFLRVPAWASSAGDRYKGFDVHQCPPRDLGEFGVYVRAVVGHYRGDIRHWEIWNEPYGSGFWLGTPEQYAEMAKVAARQTRAIDPQATVLAPSAYPNSREWVERALAAGALEGAQVFSYHGYGLLQPRAYRTVQEWSAGGRPAPLPVWNTETGVTSQTFYRHVPDKFVDHYTSWLGAVPYRTAAEDSAKLFVLALAGGAERYFQYWSVYEESLPRLSAMSLFEYDASLRPMAVAYAVAASLLDGCRGRGWLELPGPVLVSLLEDDRRSIAVAWRRGGSRPRRLAVSLDPASVEARDIMGNRVGLKPRDAGFVVDLGPEPLYLIAAADRAKLLIEALKKAELVKPDGP
jgi:hypothetical protein